MGRVHIPGRMTSGTPFFAIATPSATPFLPHFQSFPPSSSFDNPLLLSLAATHYFTHLCCCCWSWGSLLGPILLLLPAFLGRIQRVSLCLLVLFVSVCVSPFSLVSSWKPNKKLSSFHLLTHFRAFMFQFLALFLVRL